MKTRARRGKRDHGMPDLDVTPFMNLMIVLVPVLLLSMVFVHTTVIELSFPAAGAVADLQPDDIHLEIRIEDTALVVADQRGIIRRLPVHDGGHDYAGLGLVLREVKRQLPAKRDATILLAPDTDYQTLVHVVDRVRRHPAFNAGEWMTVELFPDISLGDAPERSS